MKKVLISLSLMALLGAGSAFAAAATPAAQTAQQDKAAKQAAKLAAKLAKKAAAAKAKAQKLAQKAAAARAKADANPGDAKLAAAAQAAAAAAQEAEALAVEAQAAVEAAVAAAAVEEAAVAPAAAAALAPAVAAPAYTAPEAFVKLLDEETDEIDEIDEVKDAGPAGPSKAERRAEIAQRIAKAIAEQKAAEGRRDGAINAASAKEKAADPSSTTIDTAADVAAKIAAIKVLAGGDSSAAKKAELEKAAGKLVKAQELKAQTGALKTDITKVKTAYSADLATLAAAAKPTVTAKAVLEATGAIAKKIKKDGLGVADLASKLDGLGALSGLSNLSALNSRSADLELAGPADLADDVIPATGSAPAPLSDEPDSEPREAALPLREAAPNPDAAALLGQANELLKKVSDDKDKFVEKAKAYYQDEAAAGNSAPAKAGDPVVPAGEAKAVKDAVDAIDNAANTAKQAIEGKLTELQNNSTNKDQATANAIAGLVTAGATTLPGLIKAVEDAVDASDKKEEQAVKDAEKAKNELEYLNHHNEAQSEDFAATTAANELEQAKQEDKDLDKE